MFRIQVRSGYFQQLIVNVSVKAGANECYKVASDMLQSRIEHPTRLCSIRLATHSNLIIF